MKRIVLLAALLAAGVFMTLGAVAAEPVKITYYVSDSDRDTTAYHVTVVYADTNTSAFTVTATGFSRTRSNLVDEIAQRIGATESTVLAILQEVDPPTPPYIAYVIYALLALFVLGSILANIFVVRQKTARVIERLGKFKRVANPGLRFKIPFIDSKSRPISTRIEQLNVPVETKTKDNSFLTIKVAVQHQVADVQKAYYELQDPDAQMQSYVFDVVRAKVPEMDVDDVFQNKETLASTVKTTLSEKMAAYGFSIIDSLVVDIEPDKDVKEAMNEVVKQERLKQAAEQEGEGRKKLVVKAAEAQKERDKLHGEGIAAQRKAIAEGFHNAVEEIRKAGEAITPQQAVELLLQIQYYDMLRDVGATSGHTLFLTHSPASVADIRQQITEGMLAANAADNGHAAPPAKEAATA